MKVFITRAIPPVAEELLRSAGHEVRVSSKDDALTRDELLAALQEYQPDAVISLLTDHIDAEMLAAAPDLKIVANYAVGFDNINLQDAAARHVFVTNTPGVLTDTVAEFTAALIFALTKRIPEADAYTREGHYTGWSPMLLLGSDLKGKTLGIVGCGRIGTRVSEIMAHGAGMHVAYYDVAQNDAIEQAVGATFYDSVEKLLPECDVVSIHVPLLDSTRHLMNAERLQLMKKGSYLVNTSRGAVIDEAALVDALKNGTIRAAALDVYEHEPALAEGLTALPNVIVTPHIASGSEETRSKMAEIAAQNVISCLSGEEPPNAAHA